MSDPKPDIELRALVLDAPDEYEFRTLSEAENAVGVEVGDELWALLDGRCLSYFVVHDGHPLQPEINRRLASTPAEHRGASVVSSLAMFATFERRDPVLVVDAAVAFLMFVMPAERLETYVFSRYREHVPLDPPPENPHERWVVSIARSGELLRRAVGLAPNPGIGRA